MVFDQEGSLGQPINILPDQPLTEKEKLSIRGELEAITLAESGQLEKALERLDEVIQENPLWASAFNNRAQIKRLLKRPFNDVYTDLTRSIELVLTSSDSEDPNAITERRSKVLAQAFTQRSALLSSTFLSPGSTPPTKQGFSELERLDPRLTSLIGLEEVANDDMIRGARYGNPLAKSMSLKMNPYSKMCDRIVKEAILGEIKSAQS
ncbi:hypothetical protein IE53DRAFT_385015 [Violaceomyces palustris]|uniref:Uncharacterized protein n=1 Tax=Violaceomyces palustris TaxID=1673888 RepID=A0ACD0P3B7_9BASI|nr:hypothetical protein IE53DRAFT_385015 [Violaceomyces palustris]